MIRQTIQLSLAIGFGAAPLAAQTIAITGGTVFPVVGPKIDRGTVVIVNGRITAVGAGVVVPAGATVVDATGKWVTPGLIHADANAGAGVRGLGGFGEDSKQGDFNPSFSVAPALDPDAVGIPVARTGGITTGVILPGGPFVSGTAVAVDFAGARTEDLVVKTGAALAINLGDGSKGAGGGSRAGTLARLKALFADALEYDRRRLEYRRAATQSFSAPVAELEALLPALRGLQPVLITANRKIDIQNALRLAREHRLKVVLRGAIEGWKVASEIAAANVPVVLQPNVDIPSFDGLGARLDNVTLLRQAGVKVVIAQNDPGGERSLRYAAGNAVRNGVSWDDALRAVTLWPAEVFGLGQYGALAPGRVANVVIWSGDPFEFSAAAEKVFIRGVETSLRTRETELFERYRNLPPSYQSR
ncbi:MAG: amidohydrolase family protein [Gemmatimonadales bacterium]|nr:amidohydrolase family protein [Gemmatimonadales bacterium]